MQHNALFSLPTGSDFASPRQQARLSVKIKAKHIGNQKVANGKTIVLGANA